MLTDQQLNDFRCFVHNTDLITVLQILDVLARERDAPYGIPEKIHKLLNEVSTEKMREDLKKYLNKPRQAA